MIEGWIKSTIGDQITLQRGFDITKAEQRTGAVPVISSGGVSSFHDTAMATGPGVVLGRKGVVGSVFYVEPDYWPHDTSLWVKDFHGNIPRFVYYFFKGIASQIALMDVGSANPTLNRNHVHPLSVSWPPLTEQQAIAEILGALDDKIELNRKMNATLDELARTIFRSWFVDFDPVHAKAKGREPFGMDAETAALFPDRFTDSELGPIPEGWDIEKLGNAIDLSYGRALKAPDRIFGSVAVMGSNGQVGWHNERMCEGPGIVVGRKGNPGTIHWIDTDYWPIDTSFFVRLKNEDDSLLWWFFALESQNLASLQADSAVPGLNRNIAYGNRQTLPSVGIVQAFCDIAMPLFSLIKSNTEESRVLADLRDTLLPELISGRIRVPEMEKLVAEVV